MRNLVTTMVLDTADIPALLARDLDRYFERLVLVYGPQIRAFVLRRTGSLQDAEDITQETLIRAYTYLERYSEERIRALKLRAWLFKVAWNLYCNFTTRGKPPPLISLDASDESVLLEREDDRERQPEAIFEHEELRHELESLLDTLHPRYRDVVSMYFFEELSYQEIADILNQAVGTVRVYVHRGLRELRKTIAVQKNEVV